MVISKICEEACLQTVSEQWIQRRNILEFWKDYECFGLHIVTTNVDTVVHVSLLVAKFVLRFY
jgi:hypothetical protein